MINFIGCYPIKENADVIQIEYDENKWDLHNASEFIKYSYNALNRILILTWNYYDYDSGKVINEINIELNDITMLSITPRDTSMPFIEDTCIEKLIYHSENNKLIFEFRGGIIINVICNTMHFKTKEKNE